MRSRKVLRRDSRLSIWNPSARSHIGTVSTVRSSAHQSRTGVYFTIANYKCFFRIYIDAFCKPVQQMSVNMIEEPRSSHAALQSLQLLPLASSSSPSMLRRSGRLHTKHDYRRTAPVSSGDNASPVQARMLPDAHSLPGYQLPSSAGVAHEAPHTPRAGKRKVNEMATVSPRSIYDMYERHEIIDFGSRTLVAGVQIVPKGSRPDPRKTKLLELQGRGVEIPQRIGFVQEQDQRSFRWGKDLDRALRSPEMGPSRVTVVERLKVALHDREDEYGFTAAVKGTLRDLPGGAITLNEALRLHLGAVREAMLEQIKIVYRHLFTPQDIERMDSTTFITVPANSNPGVVVNMTHAAKDAGFPNAWPISEPECAAAWFAHVMEHERHTYFPTQIPPRLQVRMRRISILAHC